MKEKKPLSLSKIIVSIVKLPINLIKYFCLGFFFSLYFLIDIIVSAITFFVKGLLLGIAVISRFVYLLIRYVSFGIIYPIILLFRGTAEGVRKTHDKHVNKIAENAKLKQHFPHWSPFPFHSNLHQSSLSIFFNHFFSHSTFPLKIPSFP